MLVNLFVLLAAVLLCGCGPVRVLNDGASGPWRVTVSPLAQTDRDYDGPMPPRHQAAGWCDTENTEIRLSIDRAKPLLIADAMHEFGHKIERKYPEVWYDLDAMDTPSFPCGSDELHAAQRAANQATTR
jgi:uncharacterized protein YceK